MYRQVCTTMCVQTRLYKVTNPRVQTPVVLVHESKCLNTCTHVCTIHVWTDALAPVCTLASVFEHFVQACWEFPVQQKLGHSIESWNLFEHKNRDNRQDETLVQEATRDGDGTPPGVHPGRGSGRWWVVRIAAIRYLWRGSDRRLLQNCFCLRRRRELGFFLRERRGCGSSDLGGSCRGGIVRVAAIAVVAAGVAAAAGRRCRIYSHLEQNKLRLSNAGRHLAGQVPRLQRLFPGCSRINMRWMFNPM